MCQLSDLESVLTLGKTQILAELTSYKKAESVDATPQDLSVVLRWA
jgi:hypothetical protein